MMKYTAAVAALLGFASASQEGFFQENLELSKLKAGVCQQYQNGYIYDIAEFDKAGREDQQPALVSFENYSVVDESVEGESTFLYKTCQPSYDLPKTFDIGTECAAKRSAYLIQNGECKYSFGHGVFTAQRKENAETGNTDLKDFSIAFESDQVCEGEKKFAFTVKGKCNAETANEASDKFTTSKINKCDVEMTYKTGAACLEAIHVSGVINAIGKFIGVILLVNGVAMAFAGSKYLFLALASLLFFGSAAIVFGLFSNLGFVTITSPKGLIIGVIVASGIVGVAVSYFGYQIAQAYATSIIGGAVGGSIAIILSGGIGNKVAKMVILFIAIAIGAYVGKIYNKYVKSIGTAIIGATMLVIGVAQYDKSAPEFFSNPEAVTKGGQILDIDELKEDKKAAGRLIAYIAGHIVISALGSFIQLKYVASDDEDEDDMMNKDHS